MYRVSQCIWSILDDLNAWSSNSINMKRMVLWTLNPSDMEKQNIENANEWIDNLLVSALIKSRSKGEVLAGILTLEDLSQKEAIQCLELYGRHATGINAND